MCVIMSKAAGAQFPPKSEIENCVKKNPDGFGAMWVSGGRVKVYKTMKADMFLKWYDRFVATQPVSTPLVCHMRIATHGSKREQNCHPWTDAAGVVGFAHNGILNIKNRKDMTDSETFFRDLWLPIWKGYGKEAAKRVTEAIVGTSRFCFLYADGSIERWGNWEQGSVKKGVYYTNSSWREPVVICRTWNNYDWTGYGYMSHDYTKEKMQWLKTHHEIWDFMCRMFAKYHDRVDSRMAGLSAEAAFEKALRDGFGFPLFSVIRMYYALATATEVDLEDRKKAEQYSNEYYKKFQYKY